MFQTTNQIKSTLFGGQLFVPLKFKGEQPTHLDVHCWLARNTIVTLGKEILASEVILSNMNKHESTNQHIEIYYTNIAFSRLYAMYIPCPSLLDAFDIPGPGCGSTVCRAEDRMNMACRHGAAPQLRSGSEPEPAFHGMTLSGQRISPHCWFYSHNPPKNPIKLNKKSHKTP